MQNDTDIICVFRCSPGEMPYPGLAGMELVDFLRSGKRLRQPDGCPDNMYDPQT